MNFATKISVKAFVIFALFIPSSWAEIPEYLTVIDFKDVNENGNWLIINDGVMGGLSNSEIVFKNSGTAVFKGTVSLENSGGFTSTQSKPRLFNLSGYTGLYLRIKGDGKKYQLRLRTDEHFDGISYRYIFSTEPENWITIRALFIDFTPVFRGRILKDVSPISPIQIKQIGFLIADKQAGFFSLEIEWIKAF